MVNMILVYVTCDSVKQAKSIAKHLMNKKLCTCVNIYPEMQPMFFWPPKSGVIDESKEVVLLIKTLDEKYQEIEDEVTKIHTYDTPCIFAIPVVHVADKYFKWLTSEMDL